MRYLSVCSGIEAASVAWHPLGWVPVAFSEIEAFPRAVLKERWPGVPLHGDFTTISGTEYGPTDLLVGGTPCQSFSVAGLRRGMADERGNLALEFLRLAERTGARWLVWENVPGVLSSNGGRDFGAFLGGLVELGYGFAYRVLDAQYVRVDGYARAVPQRRRRVFVVGHLGDWRRPTAVLFERESLSGHPAPRREAREGAAPTLAARTRGGGGLGTDFDCDGGLVAFGGNNTSSSIEVATACQAHPGPQGRLSFDSETFLVAFSSKDHGADAGEIAPTLRGMGHDGSHANGGGQIAVAFDWQAGGSGDTSFRGKSRSYIVREDGNAGSLQVNKVQAAFVPATMAVRRLTPRECERLQGFPDDYTLVSNRGKPAADGPRYKSLGNSMAVNCMRWIGQRLAAVEAIP